MADDTTATPTETVESGIDIEAASDKIGMDLFPETLPETDPETPIETVAKAVTETPSSSPVVAPPSRPVPDSWKKDYHEHWAKLDPKVQEYWETREQEHAAGFKKIQPDVEYAKSIREVLTPYHPLLQSRGLDAPRAIDDMMRAYTSLTSGTPEQRQSALSQLAKNLQIPFPQASPNGTETPNPIDPRIQALEQQFQQVQQALTASQQAALQAAQEKASAEVTAFASQPEHAFFDECHEDIVKFLKAGDSLPDAYEKAVWANPVTREKQKLAWFQTETDKQKERARLDALPKQKARSVNVQSRDTQRTPTEPLGSMDDTLRSTFRSIKEKTAH